VGDILLPDHHVSPSCLPSPPPPLPPSLPQQVAGMGQTWVSIGVISGKPRMVDTPYHQVMLFPDATGTPARPSSLPPPPSLSPTVFLAW